MKILLALSCIFLTGCSGWAFTNVSVSAGYPDVRDVENPSLFVTGTWSRVPLPVQISEDTLRRMVELRQQEQNK